MLNTHRSALAILCAALATLATSAIAAGPTGTAADYGSSAPHAAAQRSIELQADTRHLNVTRGETVTIVRAGQRFTWHVQTFSNRTVFALSEIAPKDMPVDGVQVYVAANPLYTGS
ncbi:CzcE family metal-binding protein [Janthinobacterium sp. SUN073]|uniref:CzcE family metal-binding protein n=1 Tax=Janthinobacterium sp. SUN073 TaxID=3004102 RepID=UPI0025B25420|nr:CzcE family metal-binding protein [Janthinobacterium sp. SUN073]MDN2699713.1 CzcE family metal-binding protein [Janthinobacterium sp. SUN073]